MNNLNNSQVVLLAILVSFMTSIATGIFTVTLIDQSPPVVTNTLTKVVETTVEKVIPTKETVKETVVEKVVVGAGGELVSQAISEGENNIFEIVSISENTEEEGSYTKWQRSIGFFIDSAGFIVTYLSPEDVNLYVPINETSGETLIPLELIAHDSALGVSLLKADTGNGETENPPAFPTVDLRDTGSSVGQTAIVLNGGSITVSFLSSLLTDGEFASYELFLNTDNDLTGAIVINVQNEVIGVLDKNNDLISSVAIGEFVTATIKEIEGKEALSEESEEKGV